MYVSKKVLALVLGLVLAGTVGAGLLYLELDRGNAALDRVNAEVRKGNQANAHLIEQVAQGNATIDALNGEVVTANEVNALLNEQVRKGNEIIDALSDGIDTLSVELDKRNETIVALGAEVTKGNEAITGLTGDVATLTADKAELETSNRALQHEQSALRRNYNRLQSEHRALQTVVESIDQLKSEADQLRNQANQLRATVSALQTAQSSLRQEIARLEALRRPLVLGAGSTTRDWFACTGSMEPRITCLDEATWLTDFNPADIVVGATIAYSPACDRAAVGIAHRVINITVRNGAHYFWTKGDAESKADGCWVHERDVRGYIIRIHRNVNMENAYLRNQVNGWKAEVLRLAAIYDSGALHLNPILRRSYLDSVYRSLLAALDSYGCWYQNAVDSRSPGHIPHQC